MTTLGKYELIEELGSGSYGMVYKARDTVLDRIVAIKVLRPIWMSDPGALERFSREARAAASFDHPRIATVYDFIEDSGQLFFVMKFAEGVPLDKLIQEKGKIPWSQAYEILQQVGDALGYAHGKGFIHRDVKPSNIIVSPTGGAILTDFGLAKAAQKGSGSGSFGIPGTPPYIAPEIWDGKPPICAATDIYSLACVLYEMLTGEQLFGGDTSSEIMKKHFDPLKLKVDLLPGEPAQLVAVLTKALEQNPEDRYANVIDFIYALIQRDYDGPFPPPHTLNKTKLFAGLLILAVALLVFGALRNIGNPPPSGPVSNGSPANVLNVDTRIIETPKITTVPTENDSPISTHTALFSKLPVNTPLSPSTLTPTPIITPTQVLRIGSTQISPKDGMVLKYVPAGNFIMGLDNGESDEWPVHTVYLDAFWIDRTEVTNGMYEKCVTAGSCTAPGKTASHTRTSYYGNPEFADYPVIYVNWQQAVDYCSWAGRQLSIEAQWEKAARGENGQTYPWGEGIDHQRANYDSKDTIKVGSYQVGISPYGVLDMAGNVWEWMADWYVGNYYKSQADWVNPKGPEKGDGRVLRGGSWSDIGYDMRVTERYGNDPSYQGVNLGFRCSRSHD